MGKICGGKFVGKSYGENVYLWGKISIKIYGKIPHLDGFSKWKKLIGDFFMGNCTILVIELFHLKVGKIS